MRTERQIYVKKAYVIPNKKVVELPPHLKKILQRLPEEVTYEKVFKKISR